MNAGAMAQAQTGAKKPNSHKEDLQEKSASRVMYDMLQDCEQDIEARIPKVSTLTAQEFLSGALNAFYAMDDASKMIVVRNRKAFKRNVVLAAAELGVSLDPRHGEVFVSVKDAYTSRKGKAVPVRIEMVLTYKGEIIRYREAGLLEDIETFVIHEGDTFKAGYRGRDAYFEYAPSMSRGEVTGYAVLAKIEGRDRVSFMTKQEMNEYAQVNATDFNGNLKDTWVKHPDAMAKKTIIRQMLAQFPVRIQSRGDFVIEEIDKLQIPKPEKIEDIIIDDELVDDEIDKDIEALC